MNNKNILLLEDEESLRRGICLKLEKEGYKVYSCAGVDEGIILFDTNSISLIICDITLEDGNGMDFCKMIRKKSDVHFIFLTAMDQEIDIVMGYDAGADDYITKPFSLAVFISKVNAIFKRNSQDSGNIIQSCDVVLHLKEVKAFVRNREVILTKTEWKLIVFFMENSKNIVSKQQILQAIFDVDGDFVDDNTIAVNIRRLREKIEINPSKPEYIKNIRGIGYMWNMECIKK